MTSRTTSRPPAVTYKQHFRAILVLGMPLVGSSLAQYLINLTDTVMLGWYDVTSLAAAVLATTFWFITFILGAGFANAVMPMVAAAAAEGDEVRARRVTRMGLWLSILYTCVALIPLLYGEAIFLAIGQDPEVSALAGDYLTIAAWGLIPAMAAQALRSFLSALEKTKVILWITLISLVLNAIINYALIFGNWGAPEMGIRGAATASVMMNVLAMLAIGVYIQIALPEYRLYQRWWKSDGQIMGQVARIGLPIGLTSLAEGSLFSASAVLVGWIGPLELAAHGIAIQLASMTFMFHLGMSQAATIRAGTALGRRDELALRRGGITAIMVSLVFAAVTVAVFLSFPEVLVSAFIDPTEPARDGLIVVGVGLLAMAALFQLVDAAQVMALGLLRGVQDTAVPFGMAVISYWVVGMPSSYLLGFTFGFGAVGVWLGLVVGLSVASLLLMVRFWGHSVRISLKHG